MDIKALLYGQKQYRQNNRPTNIMILEILECLSILCQYIVTVALPRQADREYVMFLCEQLVKTVGSADVLPEGETVRG